MGPAKHNTATLPSTEPRSFICDCGKEFHGPVKNAPPRWQWRGDILECDDCVIARRKAA